MTERTYTFIVTENCQLNCRYCYLVGKNSDNKMTIEVAKKAVDYIFSEPKLQECDRVIFDFIGGEPLLEIDLISLIMNYTLSVMKKCNHKWLNSFTIRLTTNGLLYGNSKIQNFIKKYKKHLSISISIDGNKEKNDKNRVYKDGTGSYDHIIDNVHLWIKQFPNEGTKMTISHDDIQYVYESLKHLVNLGIKKIDVNPIVEDVWKDNDDIVFQDQLVKFADYIIDENIWRDLHITCFEDFIGHSVETKQHLTPCGSMSLSIDPHGNFYSCIRFSTYSLRSKKPLLIGNVYSGLDSNKVRKLELHYNNIVSPNKCIECDVASGCKWCPAESYDSSANGSMYIRTTYSCNIHKAKVRAKNYYFNKLKTLGVYYDRY